MGGVWLVGRGVNLLFLNIKQTLLYSVSTLQRFVMLSVDMIIIGWIYTVIGSFLLSLIQLISNGG
jgi:hypothetical protein